MCCVFRATWAKGLAVLWSKDRELWPLAKAVNQHAKKAVAIGQGCRSQHAKQATLSMRPVANNSHVTLRPAEPVTSGRHLRRCLAPRNTPPLVRNVSGVPDMSQVRQERPARRWLIVAVTECLSLSSRRDKQRGFKSHQLPVFFRIGRYQKMYFH